MSRTLIDKSSASIVILKNVYYFINDLPITKPKETQKTNNRLTFNDLQDNPNNIDNFNSN